MGIINQGIKTKNPIDYKPKGIILTQVIKIINPRYVNPKMNMVDHG